MTNDQPETLHSVQLGYSPETGSTITIDGIDLSRAAHAVALELDADAGPRLIVDLCAVNVSATAGQVDLWLTDDARALLERAGWTPPTGGGQ